jgi:hypothetical protein
MIKYSDGPTILLPNYVNHSVSPSSVGLYPRITSVVREQLSNIRINTEVLLKYSFFPEGFLVILWKNLFIFDIHVFLHRNIIQIYSQQDAMFLDLFISKHAVHVSGGSSTHHQEHTTVQTATGIVKQYCC